MANNFTGNILTKLIHITTLNENGLHIDNKRGDTFQNLYNRKTHIAFIQERQSNPIASKMWQKEWKGKFIWHSGPVQKALGVAILFKEKLNFAIRNLMKSQNGNF